jgi:hypothetical protein
MPGQVWRTEQSAYWRIPQPQLTCHRCPGIAQRSVEAVASTESVSGGWEWVLHAAPWDGGATTFVDGPSTLLFTWAAYNEGWMREVVVLKIAKFGVAALTTLAAERDRYGIRSTRSAASTVRANAGRRRRR